jgi:hypothetical protein
MEQEAKSAPAAGNNSQPVRTNSSEIAVKRFMRSGDSRQ